MRPIPALLIPILLLVAGCGDDDGAPTVTEDAGMEHMDGHSGNSDVADGARTITVDATSFEFDPATIEARVGEAVEIELTADDVEHDFVIDELDAHVAAGAGETATGGFVADEPGTYAYYCSVPGHRDAGMEGELIVR